MNFEGEGERIDDGLRLDRETRVNLRRDGGGGEKVGVSLKDRDMVVGPV